VERVGHCFASCCASNASVRAASSTTARQTTGGTGSRSHMPETGSESLAGSGVTNRTASNLGARLARLFARYLDIASHFMIHCHAPRPGTARRRQ
jgi:hypothetical protein